MSSIKKFFIFLVNVIYQHFVINLLINVLIDVNKPFFYQLYI